VAGNRFAAHVEEAAVSVASAVVSVAASAVDSAAPASAHNNAARHLSQFYQHDPLLFYLHRLSLTAPALLNSYHCARN
jgi:hypothetical protein